MKRIILYLTILFVSLYANSGSLEIEKSIYGKIVHALTNKNPQKIVLVCYLGKKVPLALRENSLIKLVNNYKEADLIIISGDNYLNFTKNINKPMLVLNYSLLKIYPKAVGAYFWQKSRPNIVLLTRRIDNFGIKLPKEFARFEESRIW